MTQTHYIALALCSPILIIALAVVGFIVGFLLVSISGYIINKYLNLAMYVLKGWTNDTNR